MCGHNVFVAKGRGTTNQPPKYNTKYTRNHYYEYDTRWYFITHVKNPTSNTASSGWTDTRRPIPLPPPSCNDAFLRL